MKNVRKSKPLVIIQCYEDRQQTLPLRKAEQPAEAINKNHTPLSRDATDNPPPPPPMPAANGHQTPAANGHQMPAANGIQKPVSNGHQVPGTNGHLNGNHKVIDNQKPIPKTIAAELLSNPNFRKNGTLTRTPTPDYIKKTEPPPQIKNMKDEKADMESLESYKLKNPSNVLPKPPSNYFVKAPNGTATMKKHARPVSVTIGEYAYGGGSRREPTKLDFLNGDKTDGLRDADEEVSISNRLQSELALTLSRSNLRKKTEALADASR
ncbi:hypothetical protein PYW08_015360 [Mythimna loreyi]|uniref:Uncharacterized protein n=1 Tax=Mythimna loreyi TaxID=667449 RepID=A0ACC2QY53_9NEOP|nr:hypothetical protein PYW08_015360 [Mythimna loreyi]